MMARKTIITNDRARQPGDETLAFFDQFEAIILGTEDLEGAKAFYQRVFEAEWIFEDDVSAMFLAGPVAIGLLLRGAAAELTKPSEPGHDGDEPRTVFTLRVADADATCALLTGRGVTILDGPENRPWGRRTATFADPAGHLWEIAQVLVATG